MKKTKIVVILGAGENGKVIQNILSLSGRKDVEFLDDNLKIPGISGNLKKVEKMNTKIYDFFVSFGNNKLRKKWFEILLKHNKNIINAIHPKAYIERDVVIGQNVMIGANTYINIGTKIGNNVIINTSCSIDHDNVIGDHSQLTPGVMTGGKVIISKEAYIGMGVIIIDHLNLGEKSIIGAGSVVIQNVDSNGRYFGIPAKKKN